MYRACHHFKDTVGRPPAIGKPLNARGPTGILSERWFKGALWEMSIKGTKMNRSVLTSLIALFYGYLLVGYLSADQTAKLMDGTEVILKDDGTWVYADKPEKTNSGSPSDGQATSAQPEISYHKTPELTVTHQGSRGNYTLYMKPHIWTAGKGTGKYTGRCSIFRQR